RAAALRTDEGRVLGAFSEEERLDASVGRCFQRLAPARGRPAVPAALLAPALYRLLFLRAPPRVEDGPHSVEQLGWRGVRLGLGPAGQCIPCGARQQIVELGARLLRADDDDARRA